MRKRVPDFSPLPFRSAKHGNGCNPEGAERGGARPERVEKQLGIG